MVILCGCYEHLGEIPMEILWEPYETKRKYLGNPAEQPGII